MNTSSSLQTDPLTLAFMAMGAREFLTPENSKTPAYSKAFDGESETGIIEALIVYAPLLDNLFNEHAETFEGVHAYEVSEPFGRWFVTQWQETGIEPTEAQCEAKARELTRACCPAPPVLDTLLQFVHNDGLPADVFAAVKELVAASRDALGAVQTVAPAGVTYAPRDALVAALAKFA